MRRIVGCAALVLSIASLAMASDPAVDGILGRAEPAFFAGDYYGAFQQLAAAEQIGATDPRIYYFRGLCELYLGRSPDAQRDFQRGAQLEQRNPGAIGEVSKSLERVQGYSRRILEAYRAPARAAAVRQAETLRREAFAAIRQRMLGGAVAGTGARSAAAGASSGVAEAAGAAGQAPAANPADPFAAMPAGQVAAPAADPFAAQPAEAQPADALPAEALPPANP
ncbi:MAG TPA: hypothetical protein VHZ24_05465 [Pirellulales bacterium]|jgi:hypothetical protein|nr:hypothetical protein [Pirellulales bacterium]